MNKYDTIIFDLDGTLLNSLEDLMDSVNYALLQFGYSPISLEQTRQFVGNGVARLIELAIPGGLNNPDFNSCVSTFRDYYSQNMLNKTRPYEGIMPVLDELSEEGYKMAIVSNKYDSAVKGLNKMYFDKYIYIAIGESEGVLRKPAPDTVIKAIEELGSCPESTIYVGDSEVDVKTAKNAKIEMIGVTWGFRERNVLEKEGARYIIDKPGELPEILQKLSSSLNAGNQLIESGCDCMKNYHML